MNPDQLEEATARAEISKTPPGLMFGPSWRAGPSGVVSGVLEKGPEVPPGSDITGMGAQKPEPPLVQEQGPMQAVSLQEGPESEHLQPWKCLHRLSQVY